MLMVDLINQGLPNKPEDLIPVKVLRVGKESLALRGNTANLTSLKRQAGIIEAVKPTHPKLAAFYEETLQCQEKIANRANTIKSFNDSDACIEASSGMGSIFRKGTQLRGSVVVVP